jgi:hypothetical protein
MSVFSNQLFINPERPVDPFTLGILELIDQLLRDAKIRYMLVGATARDLLLYHVFGHAVTRATYEQRSGAHGPEGSIGTLAGDP